VKNHSETFSALMVGWLTIPHTTDRGRSRK